MYIKRLHDLLSHENGINEIIRWMPHGRSWIVLNKKEFLEKVAPSHFQISKFESFTRQVNGWGFKRITQGPDINSYYHEMFLRGMPHMIQWMKRTTSAGSGRRKIRADPKDEPNFYEISQMYPIPDYYGEHEGNEKNKKAKVDECQEVTELNQDNYHRSKSMQREDENVKVSNLEDMMVTSHYLPPLPSPLVVCKSYEGTSSTEDVVSIAPDEDAIDHFWSNGQQRASHNIGRFEQSFNFPSDYHGHDVTPSDRNSCDEATINWTSSYDDTVKFPYDDMNLNSFSCSYDRTSSTRREVTSDENFHKSNPATSHDFESLHKHQLSASKSPEPFEEDPFRAKSYMTNRKTEYSELNLQCSENTSSNAENVSEWGEYI